MTTTPLIKTSETQRNKRLTLIKTIVNNADELQMICSRMETFGGSWMRIQAQALRAADPNIRLRTLIAFPEIIQKYGPSGPFAD
tara:strand:- start:830 stop:1081 length:252 start_codon:yes stop_codon:yes gene_type:complete